MRWPKMPYSNMQQLNLDWLLTTLKRILLFMPIDEGSVGDVLQRKASGAKWEPVSSLTLDIHGLNAAEAVSGDDELPIFDKSVPGNRKATIAQIMSAAPVKSVNGKTGTVELGKSDVGLQNVDNVKQYSAENPPPYPVQSVNGRTGAVVLDASSVGALPSSYTPPVTSVNGKTGAVAVCSRTLLWTNPDPSSLAAGTVNVNMSGYDHIEIECTRTGSASETYFVMSGIGTESSGVTVDLTTIRIDTTKSDFNAMVVMTRTATVYLLGIVFSSGQMIFDGTYYKDWDNRAVPYRIWGIKY